MEKEINKNNIDKKKIDQFYEMYKNKILASHQEKVLESFKEQIHELNEMEILIARLEKYDKKNTEMKNNYYNYVDLAKKV